jgi:hypothetical protein
MQISDEGKIGIALGLLGLGGGGALFVLPHPYADYVGWSLIGVSVFGLVLLGLHHFKARIGALLVWLRWGGKRMWPQYLMVVSGISFFVGLVAFLQLNITPPESAPPKSTAENVDTNSLGFFATAFIRLYDTPELRRKYVFDFLAPTNARMAFYVSPSDLFIFSVTDVNSEQYSLEVPVGGDAIPLNRYIFLYCEIALRSHSTGLRILVDGKQIADRTLGFRLDLGKSYWEWKHTTIGADTGGQNNSPFKIAMFGSGHAPLTDTQVVSFQKRFEEFLVGIDSPIQRR